VSDHLSRAFAELERVLKSKSADYAVDVDPWSNFRRTGEQFGLRPFEAAEFNILQKIERLRALRSNGRPPANEAVIDTYRDLAGYGILAFAMCLEMTAQLPPANSSFTNGSKLGNVNVLPETLTVVSFDAEERQTRTCGERRKHKGIQLVCDLEFGHESLECESGGAGSPPRRWAWRKGIDAHVIRACGSKHDRHSIQYMCTLRENHGGLVHETLTKTGEHVSWQVHEETGASS